MNIESRGVPLWAATTAVLQDAERTGLSTVAVLVAGEVFWPFTHFIRRLNKDLGTERGYAAAVACFVNWLGTRAEDLFAPTNQPALFNAFLHDVLHGTVRRTDMTDPTDLWWKPSGVTRTRLTGNRVITFSDFLAAQHGTAPVNPFDRPATVGEQIAFWRRWNTQNAHTMMAHLRQPDRMPGLARAIADVGRRPRRAGGSPPAFPEDQVERLLWEGFERRPKDPRPWIRWNLRDVLITMLCLFGGVRESEPMHLWLEDVREEDGCALVLFHHPAEGRTTDPATGKEVTRAQALARRGLEPLWLASGRRRSGWKGALLNEPGKAFRLHWIDREQGRVFLALWRLYVLRVRPVVSGVPPYAFLTKDGLPMGTAAYEDSFAVAVRKIGLTPGKWAGTTPHGLRHRYGQWLNDLGLPERVGQVAMHHFHPFSQNVYRQMTAAAVTAAIENARASAPTRSPPELFP